ncbi:MAG: cysteine desulfurase family protein, partial [Planctomycetota bacterium]
MTKTRPFMRRIYLDYNATTPIAPSVVEAMQEYLSEHFGNPSSNHIYGKAAHQAVEEARRQVANLIAADPEEIVFTGGGSESSNLAIKGLFLTPQALEGGGHLIISAIEHPATSVPAEYLKSLGFEVSICGCDSRGVVDVDELRGLLRSDTRLVSIMHANNETGCIQPITAISELCRQNEIRCHTDAAQSLGKIPTNVDVLGVDLLTIAGHKLYAPKGIGALFVRRGVELEPVVHGAGHEFGLRAGTENVPYIVALGKAAELASKSNQDDSSRLGQLRDRLIHRLREEIGESLTVNGEGAERLPNTLSVNFPGVSGYDLLARTPEVCASTGAACHSGEAALSATLRAMGVSAETARGTVRLSVGWPTSNEEIDRATDLLCES